MEHKSSFLDIQSIKLEGVLVLEISLDNVKIDFTMACDVLSSKPRKENSRPLFCLSSFQNDNNVYHDHAGYLCTISPVSRQSVQWQILRQCFMQRNRRSVICNQRFPSNRTIYINQRTLQCRTVLNSTTVFHSRINMDTLNHSISTINQTNSFTLGLL